jgi:hypothetical protein
MKDVSRPTFRRIFVHIPPALNAHNFSINVLYELVKRVFCDDSSVYLDSFNSESHDWRHEYLRIRVR